MRRGSHHLNSAFIGLVLSGVLLAGCAQQVVPTAATTVGPPLPPTSTATLTATATTEPTEIVAAATASATLEADEVVDLTPTVLEQAAQPDEGIALTVLHTNDVYGYIDPCG